jgi:hypothetical protein
MRFLGAFCALGLAACGGGSSAPATTDDGLPAGCSPLRPRGACMMPYPNAIWLDQDASTKTGYRVAFTPDLLSPSNLTGAPFDPTEYDRADGFSPATPILAYFEEKIDVHSLVGPDDPSKSLDPSAATVIVDMDGNALVPHFSELDLTASQDFDRQAIMIRPTQRLRPNRRYAVAITTSIKTTAGGVPSSPPLFASIADNHPPEGDEKAARQAARMPAILASLKAAGIERSRLVVAWDFVTGSDEYLTSHVLKMRDLTLAAVGDEGLGFTIAKVEENPASQPDLLRIVTGTFKTPQFLTSVDTKRPETALVRDASGQPMATGTYDAPFTLIVPKSALTKPPLALVLTGHGLLGRNTDVIELAANARASGYVMFATDWIGLSALENPITPGGNGAAGEALTDINRVGYITDRLQQALVNAMVLGRTVRGKMAKDPILTSTGQPGGTPIADTGRYYYYGISLGGIMGGALMAYYPDIARGALNVPAGFWSLMFQRSSDWSIFELLLAGADHDFLDQQLFLAMIQMRFDFADPCTVAAHLLGDPLPGVPKKQILLQMSRGDTQVPNLATYAMARTEGIPLLAPSAVGDVFGLPQTSGPLPNALSVWDTHHLPYPPLTNATPPGNNGAHEAVHPLAAAQAQVDHFFSAGEVINTCDGACDPE